MLRILIVSLFVVLTTGAYLKGGSGKYFIKGIAYSQDKLTLKNIELNVKIGKETKTIITDDKGQFEIEIPWATACPSGISKQSWRKKTDRLNPDTIYVIYNNKEIKIKNEWEKYANLFPEDKDKVTMKRNLVFI